ncbi:MAG: IS4 family transposase [Chloroflexota bacterium]
MHEAAWAINEFGGAALGDCRRTDRLVWVATVLGEHPRAALPEACADPALLKGAYRLLENPAVTPEAILASQVPVVLAVQDTTDLDYSQRKATTGLGAIGNGFGRGLEVHSTLAITPDRVPQGVLAQEVWARDPATSGKKQRRKQRSIDEKESQKWLRGLAALNSLAPRCPQTQLISVADREADVYELFCAERAPTVQLLVRATQNRQVATARGEVGPLRATVLAQPVGATVPIAVPRRGSQPVRTATVWLRWTALTLQPPANRPAGAVPAVPLSVVWAQEEHPPAGSAALDWLLLTTLAVPDQATAERTLAYYAGRFGIEVWHKTLKTGCAIEARQLASREALQRGLALYSVIAWRVLSAALLARSTPDVPCTVLLEEREWQALYCSHYHTTHLPVPPPTLAQAVRWIAMLGGFLGRKGDGPPGPTVLWRGFQRLTDLTAMFHLFAPPPPQCLVP